MTWLKSGKGVYFRTPPSWKEICFPHETPTKIYIYAKEQTLRLERTLKTTKSNLPHSLQVFLNSGR